MSQTFAWAEAIESTGGTAFLILNSEKGVGGIVHTTGPMEAALHLECINGPLLDWDDAREAPAQFATFAMAASKLSQRFASLTIRPRWSIDEFGRRLAHLPFEPAASTTADTLILPVQTDPERQLASFTPRLRRTLARAGKEGCITRWNRVERRTLQPFCEGLAQSAHNKGFRVPPYEWFERLMLARDEASAEQIEFFHVDAGFESRDGASSVRSELVICLMPTGASYLFGFDHRFSGASSRLSASAPAHFRVLEECAKRSIPLYDLNGFTDPSDPAHPYAGVSSFKAQFGGRRLTYHCPEFRIG